jgi:hypothetical protein
VRLLTSSEPARLDTNESQVNISEIRAEPTEGPEEGDWITIDGEPEPLHPASTIPKAPQRFFSEQIAQVSRREKMITEILVVIIIGSNL